MNDKKALKQNMIILKRVLCLVCENSHFSSLFAAEDVSRETSPADSKVNSITRDFTSSCLRSR